MVFQGCFLERIRRRTLNSFLCQTYRLRGSHGTRLTTFDPPVFWNGARFSLPVLLCHRDRFVGREFCYDWVGANPC